uniref:Uncharacterized protein n=1 Tax=Anguilla anguilla TaxID=7936 RepID=A0A0E9VUG2_ANGAN
MKTQTAFRIFCANAS